MAKRRNAPTRGLVCYACGSDKVKVTESQQEIRRNGATRLAADVRCTKCRHRWWSTHPTALELSRAKDARAEGRRRAVMPPFVTSNGATPQPPFAMRAAPADDAFADGDIL